MVLNSSFLKSQFIFFSIIVGIIVAIFSVISDNIPYSVDDVSILKSIIYYLASVINSLPMWFIIAMFVGYRYASNLKSAMFFGMSYSLWTILLYLLIAKLYEDTPENISVTMFQQLLSYLTWLGASAVGGLFGGAMGFLLKKSFYPLLILLAGLVLQLFVNGKENWNDLIGILQNATFCIMIAGIIIFLKRSLYRAK
ncbi:hypothetical protein [uncultured Rummeliibacillus sp.]|uniref:hypothetical protein n=1 Tax=uncultured Rummeliibacillus sp. TaxID=762292 RepID=UPI002615908F|nr:hypothetical protein [uncultured Rummeliibacillus sp.]